MNDGVALERVYSCPSAAATTSIDTNTSNHDQPNTESKLVHADEHSSYTKLNSTLNHYSISYSLTLYKMVKEIVQQNQPKVHVAISPSL